MMTVILRRRHSVVILSVSRRNLFLTLYSLGGELPRAICIEGSVPAPLDWHEP